MKLSELKNTVPRPNRKRVGRGDGSGHGRTAGRGDKGAGQRAGSKKGPFFEGGQIPLIRRLPKRGFKNPDHIFYEIVNLSELEENFEAGQTVDRQELQARGLLKKTKAPLKVLANGEITKALTVKANKFSDSDKHPGKPGKLGAKQKIEAAGGTCIEVSWPERPTAAASAPAADANA